jgi:hypothetical protein
MLPNENKNNELQVFGTVFIVTVLLGTFAFFYSGSDSNVGRALSPAECNYWCSDTDGGQDPFLKGTISWGCTARDNNAITANAVAESSSGKKSDYCQAGTSNILREYYCKQNRVAYNDTPCQYGCYDGACNKTAPIAVCNNGVTEPGEVCDSSRKSCQELFGLSAPPNKYATCNSQCSGWNTQECLPPPDECGNGVRSPGELCDGNDLGGQTCTSLGFAGGTLRCYPALNAQACTFNTTGCYSQPNTCTDTDGGQNLLVNGTTYGWYNNQQYTYMDVCNNAFNITEYYCVGTNANYNVTQCPSGRTCSSGKCVIGSPPSG